MTNDPAVPPREPDVPEWETQAARRRMKDMLHHLDWAASWADLLARAMTDANIRPTTEPVPGLDWGDLIDMLRAWKDVEAPDEFEWEYRE